MMQATIHINRILACFAFFFLPRHSVSVYVPLERSLGGPFDDILRIYVYL